METKINELTIPAWVLTVISPDKLYEDLNLSSPSREITIEYNYIKYRLIFERDKEDVWSLITIMKRNPHGLWYKIDG